LGALVLAAAVVGILALTGVIGSAGRTEPPTAASARTIAPGTITAAPSPSQTPSISVTTHAPPGEAPISVRVPSVGVDAPVKTIAFKDGTINPPTMLDAYWIAAYGKPSVTADNTVYILGHSWDEGNAVFNALFDRQSQTSRIFPGDKVIVSTADGDVTYEVDDTHRYPRSDLADVKDVWRKVPGRLLLITCFQPNDGSPPKDNFVISAHVVS
jgi:sortase (surface protein transpeptidase)